MTFIATSLWYVIFFGSITIIAFLAYRLHLLHTRSKSRSFRVEKLRRTQRFAAKRNTAAVKTPRATTQLCLNTTTTPDLLAMMGGTSALREIATSVPSPQPSPASVPPGKDQLTPFLQQNEENTNAVVASTTSTIPTSSSTATPAASSASTNTPTGFFNNLKDSIQVNFIMGEFEGAPLQLDPLRRHKRDDVSKDIIKIPNEHGMMFIGRYDQVWHAVDEVTSGERVLIAAYASQSIGDFVEKISQNGMSFLDATEEGERRAQEKKDDDKKRKAKYRGADAANIP